MEVVKQGDIPVKKRRRRGTNLPKSVKYLTLMQGWIYGRYDKVTFNKLMDALSPKDQKDVICHFFRPAPIAPPRDMVDQLSDAQVNRLYEDIKATR